MDMYYLPPGDEGGSRLIHKYNDVIIIIILYTVYNIYILYIDIYTCYERLADALIFLAHHSSREHGYMYMYRRTIAGAIARGLSLHKRSQLRFVRGSRGEAARGSLRRLRIILRLVDALIVMDSRLVIRVENTCMFTCQCRSRVLARSRLYM